MPRLSCRQIRLLTQLNHQPSPTTHDQHFPPEPTPTTHDSTENLSRKSVSNAPKNNLYKIFTSDTPFIRGHIFSNVLKEIMFCNNMSYVMTLWVSRQGVLAFLTIFMEIFIYGNIIVKEREGNPVGRGPDIDPNVSP